MQCPFLTCRALHRLCARRHVTLANAVFRQADGTEVSPLTRCFSARGPLTPGACCRMGVYINCVSTAPQSARPLGHKTLHMQHLGSYSAGKRSPLDPVAARIMRPLTPDHAMQRIRRVVDCSGSACSQTSGRSSSDQSGWQSGDGGGSEKMLITQPTAEPAHFPSLSGEGASVGVSVKSRDGSSILTIAFGREDVHRVGPPGFLCWDPRRPHAPPPPSATQTPCICRDAELRV